MSKPIRQRIGHSDSCVPSALAILWRKVLPPKRASLGMRWQLSDAYQSDVYRQACRALNAIGSVYDEVTTEAIERVLVQHHDVMDKRSYKRRYRLSAFRNKHPGTWLISARRNSHSAHCLIVTDGEVMDNHSISNITWCPSDLAIVTHAWRLQ